MKQVAGWVFFTPHILHLFSFLLTEVLLSIMRSDILCLKDTGVRQRASTGPAQPFNWNRKRTFSWHKGPYVGFVAIRLTRKASEPDKKGLGEMYCQDIMLSVTQQLVEELVIRLGLVRQEDKPMINAVVKGYT